MAFNHRIWSSFYFNWLDYIQNKNVINLLFKNFTHTQKKFHTSVTCVVVVIQCIWFDLELFFFLWMQTTQFYFNIAFEVLTRSQSTILSRWLKPIEKSTLFKQKSTIEGQIIFQFFFTHICCCFFFGFNFTLSLYRF